MPTPTVSVTPTLPFALPTPTKPLLTIPTPFPTIQVPRVLATIPIPVPVTVVPVYAPTMIAARFVRIDADDRESYREAHERNGRLKEQLLDLTNAKRSEAGVPPVVLGTNPAAQFHSEAALDGCYVGHWDQWGLKPNHRYTLTGGSGAQAENVLGLSYCIRSGDGFTAIESMKEAVVEAVETWMGSPGHRATLLDPAHTILNLGVAYDEYNAVVVQQFSTYYVNYEQEPAIDQSGQLSLTGSVARATLDIGQYAAVTIAYDQPPQSLSRSQVAHTYSLCAPTEIAILLKPPPAGSRYINLDDLPPAEMPGCVDPYLSDADLPAPKSQQEAVLAWEDAKRESERGGNSPTPPKVRQIVAERLRTTTDTFGILADRFDVLADLSPLLEKYGPGVYTVYLWGKPVHLDYPVPLSQQSVFWMTDLPAGSPYER